MLGRLAGKETGACLRKCLLLCRCSVECKPCMYMNARSRERKHAPSACCAPCHWSAGLSCCRSVVLPIVLPTWRAADPMIRRPGAFQRAMLLIWRSAILPVSCLPTTPCPSAVPCCSASAHRQHTSTLLKRCPKSSFVPSLSLPASLTNFLTPPSLPFPPSPPHKLVFLRRPAHRLCIRQPATCICAGQHVPAGRRGAAGRGA